jgi:hypothetical protein
VDCLFSSGYKAGERLTGMTGKRLDGKKPPRRLIDTTPFLLFYLWGATDGTVDASAYPTGAVDAP